MQIKYIDTLCTDGNHLLFNASLLAMLQKKFNKIILYGEKYNANDEINILKENQIDTNNIDVKNIWLPIAKSRLSNFLLYLCSFFYNLWFIMIAKKTDILVFNYNNMLAVRTMNVFNKIFHRKILIFCHGEMEYLIADYSFFGPFNRLLFKLGRSFFLNKKIHIEKNIKFVVLGDSILKKIKKTTPPNISNSFITVDHSYFFKNNINNKDTFSDSIKIGTVGLFYKKKGADEFCYLVSLVNNNKIKFSITGKIFYALDKLKKLNIDLPNNLGKGIVPRDELEARVKKLDFILYLYPTDSYQLMASGAILDALSLQKPIIALKNDYFDYIFKKFGEFGFLFESVEKIADFLNHNNLKSTQNSFDYQSIQNRLSISTISEELNESLKKIKFITNE
jgi:putative glycosyltransferase